MSYRLMGIAALVLLASCQVSDSASVKVMPQPAIWDNETQLNKPLVDHQIWYVTDRASSPGDTAYFYSGDRSNRLSVGKAKIGVTVKSQQKRLAKQRLTLVDHQDMGHLASALPYGFLTASEELSDSTPIDLKFAEELNEQLASSPDKDLYLYVHGYKTVFENPLLLSSQLWRYMEFEGAFISFAWPSTPRRLAYFKDLETAQISGHNLRLLLEYLAINTDAEKINIVGYSAGTRVVLTALHELALMQRGNKDAESILGHVVLVASDYDRNRWATSVSIGLIDVVEHMTVYLSQSDFALAISRFLLGEARLGQLLADEEASTPTVSGWLRDNNKLTFVDVSNAEKSSVGNGHAYFKQSPWASSDLILAAKYGLGPQTRGLVRSLGAIPWTFPSDYLARAQYAFAKARRAQDLEP